MRRVALTIIAALALVPVTAQAQGNPPHDKKEPAPSGEVSPELETFGRAVAVQARLDQLEWYFGMLSGTDQALRLADSLQNMNDAANNIAAVNAMSLKLRDTLDEVDHNQRRLVASFTKLQEQGLKKLTRQLAKSHKDVQREARTVQQLMEPGHVVPQQLATGAANLEKALFDFRTDQIRMGREMGIPVR